MSSIYVVGGIKHNLSNQSISTLLFFLTTIWVYLNQFEQIDLDNVKFNLESPHAGHSIEWLLASF